MANIDKFLPKLLKWEGGYVNDPDDPGGATKYGVTLATWRQVGYDKDKDGDIDKYDIMALTPEDAKIVLKRHYWDKCQADIICSQSVAEMLVDFCYNSGGIAINKLQKVLKVPQDGVIGPQTLGALNRHPDQRAVFEGLKRERLDYIDSIIRNRPVLKKFKKGWYNRINSYKWEG